MTIEEHYSARGGILARAQDIWTALWSSLVEFISSIKGKEYIVNNKKYKVIKQLGEGGFSFVYLVKDPEGQYYALKKINCPLPEQIQLARAEILAHSLVNSPNVIKLIDAEVSTAKNNAGSKLLLPYYKNGTIQDLISKNNGNIPVEILVSYGIDICHGLLAFHSCKPTMAFRDLKPANILITDNQKAVLMDLGSVTEGRVTISTRKESVALQEYCAETVTAPYRAPELFDPPSSCVITVACDIWAFGCTLYAMAYGDSPCDGTLSSTLGGKIAFPKTDTYGKRFQDLIKGILRKESQIEVNFYRLHLYKFAAKTILKNVEDTKDEWRRNLEKQNGKDKLFILTYGSLVQQLVLDLEEPELINQQLDKMGYDIGIRIIDDFLCRTATGKCKDFTETADQLAKVGFKIYFGVCPVVSNWSADNKEFSLIFEENPLAEFVELPEHMNGLWFSNVLCGVIRGALEMIHIEVECYFVQDVLRGDQKTELKVKLIKYLEEEVLQSED